MARNAVELFSIERSFRNDFPLAFLLNSSAGAFPVTNPIRRAHGLPKPFEPSPPPAEELCVSGGFLSSLYRYLPEFYDRLRVEVGQG